jgi:hypothetical protein
VGKRSQFHKGEAIERQVARERPSMEFAFGPLALQGGGPVLITDLHVTQSHQDALHNEGRPIPNPVRCKLLLDTGADICMVKHEIAEQAGFRLLNANAPMHGVGVDTTGRRYMGRILFTFPSRISGVAANHTIWLDATIASGNFAPGIADRIDGVIGRDVLRHFEMHYNGPAGQFL